MILLGDPDALEAGAEVMLSADALVTWKEKPSQWLWTCFIFQS